MTMANTTVSDAFAVQPATHARLSDLSGGENPRHSSDPESRVFAGLTYGYMRVSTSGQNLDRQRDSLTDAGCSRIFEDHGVSGSKMRRPGLDDCLSHLRAGDTLVLASLDRLGRNTAGVLAFVDDLRERGVTLRILNLSITTEGPMADAFIALAACFAALERDLLRERVLDGLAASRARNGGRNTGGRPRSLTDEQVRLGADLREQGRSWSDIGKLLGCSERTVRRRVGALAA